MSLSFNVRGMSCSATLAINERCRELRAAGREIRHFGFGQSPFPVPEPVVEELRRNAHQKDYLPVQGLRALREAVADYHGRTDGLRLGPDDVVVGPGSKELMFLLQLVLSGETILPTPCWVSYSPQARILGRPITKLQTTFESGWRMTAEQLDGHCRSQNDPDRPRLLILNSPSNPDGGAYPSAELEALAEVARRHSMLVLSDEIYAGLQFDGRPVSIARYYPEGTIISSGLSKWCGAGGWRLGTFAMSSNLAWLRRAICAVASETYTTVSAPIQYAAVTAFRGGPEIDDYLCHARRVLAALGRQCVAVLRNAGVRVCAPAGAFYLFPDFEPLRGALARRGVAGSQALCELLLQEEGVALLPGASVERPESDLNARLAYVDFDGAAALAASRAVGRERELPRSFAAEHCGRVADGVDRIGRWVAGL